MKSVLLLLCFPCLMLFLTLMVSYIERAYRLRLRRKSLSNKPLPTGSLPLSYVPVARRNAGTLRNQRAKRMNDLA